MVVHLALLRGQWLVDWMVERSVESMVVTLVQKKENLKVVPTVVH